jgi:hypothetical protein
LNSRQSDVCLTRRHEGSTRAPSHVESINAGFRRQRHTELRRAPFNGQGFCHVYSQFVLVELVVGINWRWTFNQLAQLGASLEYAAGSASKWKSFARQLYPWDFRSGKMGVFPFTYCNDAKVTSNNGSSCRGAVAKTKDSQTEDGYCARPNETQRFFSRLYAPCIIWSSCTLVGGVVR